MQIDIYPRWGKNEQLLNNISVQKDSFLKKSTLRNTGIWNLKFMYKKIYYCTLEKIWHEIYVLAKYSIYLLGKLISSPKSVRPFAKFAVKKSWIG